MKSAPNDVSGQTTIAGVVNSAGVILSGTGFTCVKTAAGEYQIRFLRPFITWPAINVNVGADNYQTPYVVPFPDFFNIALRVVGGARTDVQFEFTAVGRVRS